VKIGLLRRDFPPELRQMQCFYILILHQISATLFHHELPWSTSGHPTVLSDGKAANSANICMLYVQNV